MCEKVYLKDRFLDLGLLDQGGIYHFGSYNWIHHSGVLPFSLSLQYMKVPVSNLWNASWVGVSSLWRGHDNLLWIIPIVVYMLLKWAQRGHF